MPGRMAGTRWLIEDVGLLHVDAHDGEHDLEHHEGHEQPGPMLQGDREEHDQAHQGGKEVGHLPRKPQEQQLREAEARHREADQPTGRPPA